MASVLRAAVARCAVRATAPRSMAMRRTQPHTSSFRDAATLRAFSTEKVTFTFIDAEGESTMVAATPGQTLLDVAHENDIELEELFEKLPEISEEEEDMLDLAWGLTDTSPSAAVLRVVSGIGIVISRVVFSSMVVGSVAAILSKDEDELTRRVDGGCEDAVGLRFARLSTILAIRCFIAGKCANAMRNFSRVSMRSSQKQSVRTVAVRKQF
ncbi:hypothetical protein FI667_g5543, partial [Globisporangium splendens]